MEELNTQFRIAIKLLAEATEEVKADWERRMNTTQEVIARLVTEQEAIAKKWYADNEASYKTHQDEFGNYHSADGEYYHDMGVDIYEKCPIISDYEALVREWGDYSEHLVMYQDIFDLDCEDGCESELHKKFELHPETFSNLDAMVVALVANGGLPIFGSYPDLFIDQYQARMKRNQAIMAAQTLNV